MIHVFKSMVQGSDEWRQARCGLLTASEMDRIITPTTLKYSASDKERTHLYELAAQRITSFVEEQRLSPDMERGIEEEPYARHVYSQHYGAVEEVGFVVNDGFKVDDDWTFAIGASPDGFIGDEGLLEIKAPRQKKQFVTIVSDELPAEHVIQVQTELLVAERRWCDFVSFHGGMPMCTIRVMADPEVQKAIVEVATVFHKKLRAIIANYHERLADPAARLVPTDRRLNQEMR